MRQSLLMLGVILAGLFGFTAYCWVLIDWYQAMQLGWYAREPLNTLLESVVIVAYSYLAFRFFQFQQKRIQPPDIPLPRIVKAVTTPQPSGWFGKRLLTGSRSKSRG